MPFERVTYELPPASVRGTVVHDRATGALLQVARDGVAVQIWRWTDGRWVRDGDAVMACESGAHVFAAYDRGRRDVVVGVVARDPADKRGRRQLLEYRYLRGSSRNQLAFEAGYIAMTPAAASERTGVLVVLATERNTSVHVRIDGDTATLLDARKAPLTIVWDEAGEQLIGADDRTYRFDGRSWQQLDVETLYGTGLADDVGRHGVVRVARDALVRLDGDRWAPTGITVGRWNNGAALVSDGRTMLLVGGQDFGAGGGSPCSDTYVLRKTTFVHATDPHAVPAGRYGTAVVIVGRFTYINHSARARYTRVDRAFVAVPLREDTDYDEAFDDRYANFASDGQAIWAIGADDKLYCAPRNKRFSAVADIADGPGTFYSGRVAMAWDPLGDRLVVFGGEGRNDTWVYERGAMKMRELRPAACPPHGVGGLCATPAGMYLITPGNWEHGTGELWRFVDDTWTCVGIDATVRSRVLLHDARRSRLLAVNEAGIHVWEDHAFRHVADLPAGVRIPADPNNGTDTIGIDPATDRLVIIAESGVYDLALAELGLAPGTLPTAPVVPTTTRHRTPPAAWVVPAARLRADPKRRILAKQLPAAVPKRSKPIACVPLPPDVLAVRGATHLLIVVSGTSRATTRAILVDAPDAPTALYHDDTDALCAATLDRFDDVLPAHELEVDTLPRDQHSMSFTSKVGGVPRFIQDEIEVACPACATPMRFAVQLDASVYGFGDVGKLYAFVCPDGCAAEATVQTH